MSAARSTAGRTRTASSTRSRCGHRPVDGQNAIAAQRILRGGGCAPVEQGNVPVGDTQSAKVQAAVAVADRASTVVDLRCGCQNRRVNGVLRDPRGELVYGLRRNALGAPVVRPVSGTVSGDILRLRPSSASVPALRQLAGRDGSSSHAATNGPALGGAVDDHAYEAEDHCYQAPPDDNPGCRAEPSTSVVHGPMVVARRRSPGVRPYSLQIRSASRIGQRRSLRPLRGAGGTVTDRGDCWGAVQDCGVRWLSRSFEGQGAASGFGSIHDGRLGI